MKLLPRLAALLLLLTLAGTAVAQQKKQAPPKPQPKPTAAPTPPPTFDTLIPADKYFLYLEARNAGHLIQSNSVNEVLEPILNFAAPPKEFNTMVKWLHDHAADVMTSRMLVTAWPRETNLPEVIIAVEFASPEEAAKFRVSFNAVLKGVIPPTPVAASEQKPDNVRTPAATKPRYYLRQLGSLVVLTPTALDLKKVKPAGSKLLSDDTNFRAARTRFNSESVFLFVDMKQIEQQEEERRKLYEKQLEEERLVAVELEAKKADEPPPPAPIEDEVPPNAVDSFTIYEGRKKDSAGIDPAAMALMSLAGAFFTPESKWPDAIAVGLSLENDSFDVRALLLNDAGEKIDPVPFLPILVPGPPVVFEAPNIVPADTQFLATMSLDLPQMYAAMAQPRPTLANYSRRGTGPETNPVSPFAELEKKLQINLRNDLLPLLGTEIAVRLPLVNLHLLGLGAMIPTTSNAQPSEAGSPAVLISVRDKEAVRALLPKLIDALGFKGASALAQTERRSDTEIVSYLNLVSYAFIGNFLVLSGDPATVRQIVDSYLKNETLAGESHFRNFTRWQPRPSHGQVYVSPAFMQGYVSWAEQSKQISEQTKLFLTQLSLAAQPITYSLSNEGFGPLHELHLPKSLVLMAVAGMAGAVNSPRQANQESMAQAVMMQIAYFEEDYKKEAGSYGTLEQLIAAKVIDQDMVEQSGYKFEILVSADKFEVYATPVEYGPNGKRSYFIDQTRILRGADRNGAPASSSDPPIY